VCCATDDASDDAVRDPPGVSWMDALATVDAISQGGEQPVVWRDELRSLASSLRRQAPPLSFPGMLITPMQENCALYLRTKCALLHNTAPKGRTQTSAGTTHRHQTAADRSVCIWSAWSRRGMAKGHRR